MSSIDDFYLSKFANYPDIRDERSKERYFNSNNRVEDIVSDKIDSEFDKFEVSINNSIILLGELEEHLKDVEKKFWVLIDIRRNQMEHTQVKLAVVGVPISFAAVVTGAFGMNLDNAVKFGNVDMFFYLLCAVTTSICVVTGYFYWSWLVNTKKAGIVPEEREIRNLVHKKRKND